MSPASPATSYVLITSLLLRKRSIYAYGKWEDHSIRSKLNTTPFNTLQFHLWCRVCSVSEYVHMCTQVYAKSEQTQALTSAQTITHTQGYLWTYTLICIQIYSHVEIYEQMLYAARLEAMLSNGHQKIYWVLNWDSWNDAHSSNSMYHTNINCAVPVNEVNIQVDGKATRQHV